VVCEESVTPAMLLDTWRRYTDCDSDGQCPFDHVAEGKTMAMVRFGNELVYKLVPTTP